MAFPQHKAYLIVIIGFYINLYLIIISFSIIFWIEAVFSRELNGIYLNAGEDSLLMVGLFNAFITRLS